MRANLSGRTNTPSRIAAYAYANPTPDVMRLTSHKEERATAWTRGRRLPHPRRHRTTAALVAAVDTRQGHDRHLPDNPGPCARPDTENRY
ncbi:hypothetical protein T261_3863 [Streptomyces lydicus]|nr:hypothetical protein T261_3863 [Streptomyces lydicus]